MKEPEDILIDFEEKEPEWTWHDELAFTMFITVMMPFILLYCLFKKSHDTKQRT